MKNLIKIIAVFMSVIMLTSCGGKPIDRDNKNKVEKNNNSVKLTGTDIYYDVSSNMKRFSEINKDTYRNIVYASATAARDTWHAGDISIYKTTDKVEKTEFDFLNYSLDDDSAYSENYYNSICTALKNVKKDRMNIIITDLQSSLYDYSVIANSFVENVLTKDLSIGFIGVQMDIDDAAAAAFFIVVISDNNNLSKYMNAFKNHPSILQYAGKKTDFQTDKVGMINYQIIANESGIQGIDYKNIKFIENGFYAGADGNIDQQESKGSFTKLRADYNEEQMESIIEGTVNFSENVQQFVNIKKKSNDDAEYVYKGVRSLVYDKKSNTSGKIKVQIPFNVISGVKLSKINCDLETAVYATEKGEFGEQTVDSDIKVSLASAATPEQGVWRVDDETNSVILNIMVPNAADLPTKNGAVKIDVTFNQRDTIDSVSQWVRNWEERNCTDLINLFNSLYTYQREANVAKNSITIYLAPGNKKITTRLEKRGE